MENILWYMEYGNIFNGEKSMDFFPICIFSYGKKIQKMFPIKFHQSINIRIFRISSEHISSDQLLGKANLINN